MNVVTLTGILQKDPEVLDLGGNSRMVRYTLSVRRRIPMKDGAYDFVQCVCFGKPALNAEKYYKEGMKISIVGRIRTSRYVNKKGETVYSTDVIVDEGEFSETKKEADRRMKAEKEAEKAAREEAKNNPPEPVETPREAPTQSEPTPVNNKPVPMEDEFMQIPDDFGDEMPFR